MKGRTGHNYYFYLSFAGKLSLITVLKEGNILGGGIKYTMHLLGTVNEGDPCLSSCKIENTYTLYS